MHTTRGFSSRNRRLLTQFCRILKQIWPVLICVAVIGGVVFGLWDTLTTGRKNAGSEGVEVAHSFGQLAEGTTPFVLFVPKDARITFSVEEILPFWKERWQKEGPSVVGGCLVEESGAIVSAGYNVVPRLGCDWEKDIDLENALEGLSMEHPAAQKMTHISATAEIALFPRSLLKRFMQAPDVVEFSLQCLFEKVDVWYDPRLSAVIDRLAHQSHPSIRAELRWQYLADNHGDSSVHGSSLFDYPIVFSSLLGPVYSDTGFFKEAVPIVNYLVRHAFVFIDQNCDGWLHHDGECVAQWVGAPSPSVKWMLSQHSMSQCKWNVDSPMPSQPVILIRHLPLDWFGEPRINGAGQDCAYYGKRLLSFGKRTVVVDQDGTQRRLYRIARTMYESDSIADEWVAQLNHYDEIWVPSPHSRRLFVHSGVSASKIKVLPEALSTEEWFAQGDPVKFPRGEVPKKFVILSVLKWEERKGWDVLLKSYLEEMSTNDDVTLIIRSGYLDRLPPIENVPRFLVQQLAETGHTVSRSMDDLPHVLVLQYPLTDGEMVTLFQMADVFALTSRGEGWGLPYHQAMGLGKPCIATGWSGNMAFMTEENSFLVRDFDLVKSSQLHGKWAEPSVAATRRLLRYVLEHPDEVQEKGRRAQADMKAFEPDVVGSQILKELERIRARLESEESGGSNEEGVGVQGSP